MSDKPKQTIPFKGETISVVKQIQALLLIEQGIDASQPEIVNKLILDAAKEKYNITPKTIEKLGDGI